MHAIVKPGYYDGPYYRLEDGNYIVEATDNKVDVYMKDPEDFIYDILEHNPKATWEFVKEKFKFVNVSPLVQEMKLIKYRAYYDDACLHR